MRWPTCPFLEQLGPIVTWMHAQGFQPLHAPQVNGQQEHQPDLDMYISDLITESEGPLTLMGARHLISPRWLGRDAMFLSLPLASKSTMRY